MDAADALKTDDPVAETFLSLTTEALVLTDADHAIGAMSRRAEELFGCQGAELTGAPLSSLLGAGVPPPAAGESPHEYVMRLVAEDGEVMARRPSGEEFPVEARCAEAEHGDASLYVLLLRDISERRVAETALLRALEARDRILESAGEGIYGLDANGLTTFVNPAGGRMLGWDPRDLLGKPQHELIHHTRPDGSHYDAETCPVYAAFSDGEVHHVDDEVFWRRDGSSFPVEYVSTPIRGPDGELSGAVVTFRDITERRQAEVAVAAAQRSRSLILESAAEGIYGLDVHGRTTFVNPAAAEMLGWETEDLLGEPMHDVSHHSHPDGSSYDHLTCPIYAAFSDGRVHHVEDEVFWRKDGSSFPVEYSSTPIHGESGELMGAVVTFSDITKRKEAEDSLRGALAELGELKDRLAAENEYLKEELDLEHGFEEIIGSSRPLKGVLRKVEQVAATPASVLLIGETGTGKELFARAIHRLSDRADRPMVKVNCAALPSNLVESELFGHERGAFTGAVARRVGRFALAHGGTIFLDEIGDVPMDVQAKLLRVLQEGEFDPVGGTKTQTVDVRVIAATNRNLLDAIAAGEFRADLYYRLSVFPIEVPPLRERTGDVVALTRFFVERYSRTLGRETPRVTGQVLEALQRYRWPGNVRELQNVIERAVIVSRGGSLRLEGALYGSSGRGDAPKSEALEEVERAHILRVLESTRWQVAGAGGAAERLRMNPSTLRSRIAKLGIERPAPKS